MSFSKLPSELMDEIVSYLISSPWHLNNTRKTRQPIYTNDIHSFDFLINVHRGPLALEVRSALGLRLLSREFNAAMLRAYFGICKGLAFPAHGMRARQDVEEHVIREGSAIAPLTTRLRVELSPGRGYEEDSLFYKRYEGRHVALRAGSISLQEEKERLGALASCLGAFLDAGTLARAVGRMPKLQALVVNLNEKWRCDAPDYYPEDVATEVWNSENEDEMHGLVFRQDLLRKVRESVAAMLSPGLDDGAAKLESLTYLRLTLPCAYDFAVVSESMPDGVAQRLRHLYLEYIDGTGDGGDVQYRNHEDSAYALSNLQKSYPNADYIGAICALVSRCTNLSSLGLVGTQEIDCSLLNWRHAAGAGLKNIYLQRVVLNTETLLRLMDPNIEALQVSNVELTDGTWEAIFKALHASSKLVFLDVNAAAYSTDGVSAHLGSSRARRWEENFVIYTKRFEDTQRLRDVVRAIQGRGGCPGNLESLADEVDEEEDDDDPMSWVQPMD